MSDFNNIATFRLADADKINNLPADTNSELAGKADASHTHDDRYYTETETNSLLNGKQSISEKGQPSGYASLDGTGKVPASQLPATVVGGDMSRSTYDVNNNGIVDDTEKLGGELPSYYLDVDNHTDGTTNKVYTTTEKTKLAGIEEGAEVNNISDANATDLTDGGDTELHTHDGRYYTETETDNLLNAKANDTDVVKLTGDQTISGNKTFSNNVRAGFIQSDGNGSFGDLTDITGNYLNIWHPTTTNSQIDSYTNSVGFRDLLFNGGALIIKSAGNVGFGTTTPNESAKLELSSTTQGFLPPRMTTVQRDVISTPAEGLIIYNTTTDKLNAYDGSAWQEVGGGGGASFDGIKGFPAVDIYGEVSGVVVGKLIATASGTFNEVRMVTDTRTTGTTTITVKKNGVSIGTVTVTSATNATNSVYIGTSSGITASYVAGDVITYEWSDTGSPAGTGLHITNL